MLVAGNVEVFGTLLLVLLIIGGAFWLKRRRS
jgi:flagellar biogenesis protein FliO